MSKKVTTTTTELLQPADSNLIAAALVFKLKKYHRELAERSDLSESETRHCNTLRAGALVLEQRERMRRAKLLNGRW